MPFGVPGEMYVGGAGLTRGYLKRPELTAEKFIPDPHSTEPGARLYRTGDVARYRAVGELEYFGRSDEQVKVRGFRIELGEIESVLNGHPAVSECAVVAGTNGKDTDKRLVAYVASGAEQKPGVSELRTYLQKKLPDYMIPAQFVLL